MTHQDKGKFARKHGPDQQPLPRISEAVKRKAVDGGISCVAAFAIAADCEASPSQVGLAIDCLEVSIVKCQLGLFGYGPGRGIVEPAAEVSPDLEAAIRNSLVQGRLPCAAAWQVGEELGVPKLGVSSACERLQIKISPCQLGAF